MPTIWATLAGFAASLSAAAFLSVLIDFARPLRRALFPVLIISQTLPLVAIAPLVVLWFGFGLLPKILLVALVTFFPMLVALVDGYEATEPEFEQLLASMGASRWTIFRRARMSSALPFFFAGLRISITYAVVAAKLAEYAGAARGLGIYILNAKLSAGPRAGGRLRQRHADARAVRDDGAHPAPLDALAPGGASPVTLLRLHDVALSRGGMPVLGGVSLHVDEGEFVSILGPSGAGKSTLSSS